MEENKSKKLVLAQVFSNKKYEEGTLTVLVLSSYLHKKYGRVIKTKRKFVVHYPQKEPIEIGDAVLITQCAPVSKLKRFCVNSVGGKK